MRMFIVQRHEDVSGVSGIGTVAEGIEFSDGRVVLRWTAKPSTQSTVMFDCIDDAVLIHGHDGKTRFEFLHEE